MALKKKKKNLIRDSCELTHSERFAKPPSVNTEPSRTHTEAWKILENLMVNKHKVLVWTKMLRL